MNKTPSYIATLLCATSLATLSGCSASSGAGADDSLESNLAQSSAGNLSYNVETKIAPAYMANNDLPNTLAHGLVVANAAKTLSITMGCEAVASEEATTIMCSSPVQHGVVDVTQNVVLSWDYKADKYTAESSITKIFAPGPAPAKPTAAEGFFLGASPVKSPEKEWVGFDGKTRAITWSSKQTVVVSGLVNDPVKNPFLLMKPTSEAMSDIKADYQPKLEATGRKLEASEWFLTARQSLIAGHVEVFAYSEDSAVLHILATGALVPVSFLKIKTDITSVLTKKSDMLPAILDALEASNDASTFVKKP